METERLRLREWLPEDREPLAAMNADRRVMEFFPHPLSRAESDAFFDRIVAEWAESGRGLYAVERRGDGRLIGLTGLHRAAFEASFTPCIEIGWRFVAEVWGRAMPPKRRGPCCTMPSAGWDCRGCTPLRRR